MERRQTKEVIHLHPDTEPAKLQPNIGTLNRFMRMSAGAFLMATAMSERKHSVTRQAVMAAGAMKIAEGVLGWCPLTYVIDKVLSPATNGEQQGKHASREHESDRTSTTSEMAQKSEDKTKMAHRAGHDGSTDAPIADSESLRGDSNTPRHPSDAVDALNTAFQ